MRELRELDLYLAIVAKPSGDLAMVGTAADDWAGRITRLLGSAHLLSSALEAELLGGAHLGPDYRTVGEMAGCLKRAIDVLRLEAARAASFNGPGGAA